VRHMPLIIFDAVSTHDAYASMRRMRKGVLGGGANAQPHHKLMDDVYGR
jgi:hypothetical protein